MLKGLRMENIGIGILWSFGIFYGHFGIFMAIWYCCGNLIYFFSVLVNCLKKNLATLFLLKCKILWNSH
jgi:hypothetical protein